MNPRVFDLVYHQEEKSKAKIYDILKGFRTCGFITRKVSSDQLDKEVDSLPLEARFSDKRLIDAGVENLYVPKKKYRDLVLERLSIK